MKNAALEDAALAADPGTQQFPTTSTTTAPVSTPAWAVALIVVGSLVGLALIVVQVQLVLIFRKKAAAAKDSPAGLEFA